MRRRRNKATTDARTEVLDRIRAALAGPDGVAVGGTGEDPATTVGRPSAADAVVRHYRSTGVHEPGSPALIEMLTDRLADYRAVVHEVADASELPAALRRVLAGVRTAVVPPWLDSAWVTAAAGAGVAVRTDAPTVPLSTEALESVEVVLTGARVAIAETGTIVLDAGPDQGRRIITLLPDRHVCIVRAGQVVQTVPEAIAVLGRSPARPQTWISGPSATSDIELTRVEGVHGPRRLDVVLLRS